MKRSLTYGMLIASSVMVPTHAEQLTIDRLFSSPSLHGQTAKSLTFSPDGSRITYLQGKKQDKNQYDLWEYHIASQKNNLLVDSTTVFSGKETLSDEEKARRERQRVYGQGIMSYQFSEDGQALLFPLNGDIYYYELSAKVAKRLTKTPSFETDVKFSPLGNYISFIREQNLYIIDLKQQKEIQLTTDGGGTLKNGMSEFVAQEEMNRMTGYWWSPTEQHIAFLKVDESPVNVALRNEIYADEIKIIEQRYPYTGTPNVKIGLQTVEIQSKRIDAVDLGTETDFYLPRVKWFADGKTLSYQWQSRDQKTLQLNAYDLVSKQSKPILTETAKHWINLHKDLHFLTGSQQFIWASERDGFKHLYLYHNDGRLVRQLTQGDWVVDALQRVDEKQGWVYFTGRVDTPLERHLYKVPLNSSSQSPQRISQRDGFHQITFAKQSGLYLDRFSNVNTPPQVSLHRASGEHVTWLVENPINEQHPVQPYYQDLIQPEFGWVIAEDGKTRLYYKLYKPAQLKTGQQYPVIVRVYGGPIAQRVTNKWSGADITQYWVQQGYVVFQLDNRGSNYRGSAFEAAIYRHLGEVELADQVTGVKYLHTLPYVDKERIGIFGHSYGGYMAIMAMFKAGDYFKAGVSGAPVTDWHLYDTHYTERYLGHPQTNAEGYQSSSVFPYVSGLSGGLLLYHGMADDNVLFTNATKLMKALQDQNKLFELMTYPGTKHSMRGKPVRVHLYRSITDFFQRQL